MNKQTANDKTKRKTSLLPCSPAPLLPTPCVASLLLALLILAFAIFFSALAVQQHRAYLTNGLDVGNVDQALWNTAQGRFLHFTLMAPVQSRLALHVEPVLLFFVPFYWLNLGGPQLLLVAQATIVALGAWPLYQIACHALHPPHPSTQTPNPKSQITPHSSLLTPHSSLLTPHFPLLAFPLAYLLLPTLQSAVLFDFHAVTLASTFLLFAFWALEKKHNRRFFLFAILAMACKEDMPLVVAMLGLYAGLARRRWRLAGLTVAASLAWFGVAVFIIQPQFAAGGNVQLDRYAWLGNSLPQILATLITRPNLVISHLWQQADLPGYLAALFFPTAFLALFSPLTLLPVLPSLAVNLLSSNPFTWRLEDFHYGAPLAPFLLISAIYGVKNITRWATPHPEPLTPNSELRTLNPELRTLNLLLLLLLTFTGIYHYHRGFTPLARPFRWPGVTAHHRQLDDVLATIPSDAPLFTQSNLAPHLTHRAAIYTDFAYFTDPQFPAATPATDVVLDVTTFENIGGLHQFLRQTLLEGGDYRLVTAQDGILHLTTADRRPSTAGHSSSSRTPYSILPTPFYTFTHPDPPPDHPLNVDFGDTLRLRGYSLHFNRQEEIQVTVDLELLQPLEAVQPVLYLLDAQGQPAGATTDLQPALVWFPPERWPVGQTVRVRFNTLPWHTRQTAEYGLALGVINGSDVWDVGSRRRPTPGSSTPYATRLPAGGTLLELAHIEQRWNIPTGGPRPRQFTPPFIPHPLEANFANQIKLLGHTPPKFRTPQNSQPQTPNSEPRTLNPEPRNPNSLTLTLTWQALTHPEPLTRFVQLIGPDGQVYGQQDSAPDFGNYPTQLWQPGEVVAETVTLPVQPERPAGRYSLHVGLYRPATGRRLLRPGGGDHVEIPLPR